MTMHSSLVCTTNEDRLTKNQRGPYAIDIPWGGHQFWLGFLSSKSPFSGARWENGGKEI